MTNDAIINEELYDELRTDPWKFLSLSQEELFQLDPGKVEALRLELLKRRFEELRPKLRALRQLAQEVEIEHVESIDDLSRLSMPHTTYKSYSVADVQQCRFDRLSKWLQALTTHDLSQVDASDCRSLEAWMVRLEETTPLRLGTSSGTSGKISMFPTSTVEEMLFVHKVSTIVEPFLREPGIDMKSGDYIFISPWPAREGRHNFPNIMRMFKKHCYGGRDDMFITLGEGAVTADEMWLAGRLQRAQALGESMELTPAEQELARAIAARNAGNSTRWESFVERAIVGAKGRKVVFFGPLMSVYQLAVACRKRGIVAEWHPDSIILTGGGTKGFTFPDGWLEVVKEAFAHHWPNRVKETFGMTESSAAAVRCAHDKFHVLPWGISHVVDHKTGQSLPRAGTQYGRLVVFDPLPRTFWSGTITGDAVTMHYDGGCPCGRLGPFLDNDIKRFTELQGGDDKITCARTPQAFERLDEYLSSGM